MAHQRVYHERLKIAIEAPPADPLAHHVEQHAKMFQARSRVQSTSFHAILRLSLAREKETVGAQ